MALFNNTFKAAALFAALTWALYGSRPTTSDEAQQKYSQAQRTKTAAN